MKKISYSYVFTFLFVFAIFLWAFFCLSYFSARLFCYAPGEEYLSSVNGVVVDIHYGTRKKIGYFVINENGKLFRFEGGAVLDDLKANYGDVVEVGRYDTLVCGDVPQYIKIRDKIVLDFKDYTKRARSVAPFFLVFFGLLLFFVTFIFFCFCKLFFSKGRLS